MVRVHYSVKLSVMIDHCNAFNLLAVQIVQWKIWRQKAANICSQRSEKTLAGRDTPLPSPHPRPNRQKHCVAPSKKWPGHNGHRLPPAWKPVKLQIFPIVTNARCRVHVPGLLLPKEIRSSGDGSSFNGGIANARKSKKAGLLPCYCVGQSMCEEWSCRSKHMIGTHWKQTASSIERSFVANMKNLNAKSGFSLLQFPVLQYFATLARKLRRAPKSPKGPRFWFDWKAKKMWLESVSGARLRWVSVSLSILLIVIRPSINSEYRRPKAV